MILISNVYPHFVFKQARLIQNFEGNKARNYKKRTPIKENKTEEEKKKTWNEFGESMWKEWKGAFVYIAYLSVSLSLSVPHSWENGNARFVGAFKLHTVYKELYSRFCFGL